MRRIVLALLQTVAPLGARAQASLGIEVMLGAPRVGLHRSATPRPARPTDEVQHQVEVEARTPLTS